MKTLLWIGGALLLGGLAFWMLASSRPDHHGQPFRGLPEVPVADLVSNPAGFVHRDVRITGRINRQCPSAGCWFFLEDPSGSSIKVEMGDTTPKLPARVGRTAVVEGQLVPYGEGHLFVGVAVEFGAP